MKQINKIIPINFNLQSQPHHTFLDSIKYPMILVQCFGFFPVNGLRQAKNYRNIKFKWKTWRMAYSLFIFILFLIIFVIQLIKTVLMTERLKEISKIIE